MAFSVRLDDLNSMIAHTKLSPSGCVARISRRQNTGYTPGKKTATISEYIRQIKSKYEVLRQFRKNYSRQRFHVVPDIKIHQLALPKSRHIRRQPQSIVGTSSLLPNSVKTARVVWSTV